MPLFPRLLKVLQPFHPARFPYLRFGLTVLVGCVSGYVFQKLNIPLPWLLGPMCVITVAVLFHAPVSAPAVVRPPVTAMLGVMLGTTFSPALLAQIPQWSLTLALQLALLVVFSIVSVWYYRVIAGLDPVTAYYSGMPGGMMEMSMAGEEEGGDGQAIILIHSARVLIIVGIVPFIVQFIEGVNLGPRQASNLSVSDAPFATFLWLAVLAVIGSKLGEWLRIPVHHLFGPMFLSILVHGTGMTDFVMPREIVIAAQIMLGCVTGCRFIGFDKREILRILAYSIGATTMLLLLTVIACYGLSLWPGVGLTASLLALAPAGIAEMSLVAVALHVDVAFVLVHQLARIVIVASVAAPVRKWLGGSPRA